jgi:hypothetical protein
MMEDDEDGGGNGQTLPSRPQKEVILDDPNNQKKNEGHRVTRRSCRDTYIVCKLVVYVKYPTHDTHICSCLFVDTCVTCWESVCNCIFHIIHP